MDRAVVKSALLLAPAPALSARPQFRMRRGCGCVKIRSEGGGGAGAGTGTGEAAVSGRERRRQRQQRREANSSSDPLIANWREQVEDRLLEEAQKYKKEKRLKQQSQLSINTLSALGPQWWALHVSRHRTPDIAAAIARSLSASFPDLPVRVYNPCISERTPLKDGHVRLTHRPLVPGIMYLHCTLNRQLHHLVESCPGVHGFKGSQVVARDEQFFTKPKPVSPDEIETILLREREEQAAADKAYQDKQAQSKKPSPRKKVNYAYFFPGVSVRVLSGPFADYTGCLKDLNIKKKKATVELLLFGKETSLELNIAQIEAVTA